ncbi:MAG: lipopolysaccharide heptosyltransferase II [Elusimicrobia bacterium]|nr:lipopolysaccharide heptosyltransferase II [Elusimicrobiota bacterium]
MHPNILVVRLSSLGDVVLTTPVYRNLKSHWPQCRISVLVKPQYVSLLQGHPCIDEVLPFRNLWGAARAIKDRRFTHLLDLHANLRSLLLGWISNIPNISRYRKDALARRLFVTWRRPNPALAKHTLERYLESLHAWGVPAAIRDLDLNDYRARPLAGSAPRRILIIQTAFLGDATLTVPLAREVKKLLPTARLSVLCRPDTADVFRSCGWADEVLLDDKRGKDGGPIGVFRLARELRDSDFDLALIPHRSLRSAVLAWWADIPRRVGFSSSAGRFLMSQTVPFTWTMHDLDRNLALLLPLRTDGPLTDDPSIYLRAANEGRRASVAARPKDALRKDSSRLVGVHPGSIWPTKRWPAQRFAALIRRLSQDAGARILLVGGGADRSLASEIIRKSGVEVLDWTGTTTLTDLIALMRDLDLFITNDSGPMHIAAASGVPTLALFGPTTRELGFFPYGRGHRVLEANLSCRPCSLHGGKTCPEGHFLCMRLITVDQAYRAAVEMLERSSKRPRDVAASSA